MDIDAAARSYILPEKSKKRYENAYKNFKEWCGKNNAKETQEETLMAYLLEKSVSRSPTSLWCEYSMLKSMMFNEKNIDISKFYKVKAFLKKKNLGYKPKKFNIFTRENIDKFLSVADDKEYLMNKAAMIIGIGGACSAQDLCDVTMDNVQVMGNVAIVKIPQNGVHRIFTITPSMGGGLCYLKVLRNYLEVRTKVDASQKRFFLRYVNGKCFNQPIGKHSIAGIPCRVAKFLGLSDAKMYTSHTFRKSSAVLLGYIGGNVPMQLKRNRRFGKLNEYLTPTPPPSPSADNGETNESQDIPEDNNEDESFERGEEEVDFNDLNNDTVVIDPTTSADGSLFNPNQFPTELECDLFGEYVSKHLQELPLEVALHLQYEIQHLVMMTRLHYNSHYANQTSTTIKEEVEDEAEIPPEEEPIAESDENPSTNEELYIDPEPPEAKRRKFDSNPDSKPSAPQPEQTKRTSCTVFAEHIAVQLEQLPDELAQHLQTNIYAMISEVLPQFYKDDPPGNVPVKTEAVDVSQTEILHDYELD